VGASAASAERKIGGTYGGFGLMGLFGVGGMGTELETNCSTLGAASCTTPSPAGGGAFGYVGWTWDPVGFEVMLGGEGDTTQQTAHFNGLANSVSPLPAATPARNEVFTFVRAGGLGAFRVRATFQGNVIRATVAGGLGFSYKVMLMKRDATTTAEQPQGTTPSYVPGSVAYVSPALSLEAAVHFRVSPSIALAVGLELWAENASIAGTNSVPSAKPEPIANPNAGVNGSTAAPQFIPTPAYNLATGPQVFLGPFLGMQFGP
jgi:hypothetical protein